MGIQAFMTFEAERNEYSVSLPQFSPVSAS